MAVITDGTNLQFDEDTNEMHLSHVYTGVSVEEIKKEVVGTYVQPSTRKLWSQPPTTANQLHPKS